MLVIGSACEIWVSGLRWAMPRLRFDRTHWRPIYFRAGPINVFLDSAGVIWGPLCGWARPRVLFDRALGGQI